MLNANYFLNEWPSKCLGFIGNELIFIYRVGENIKIAQMDLTVTHPRNQVSEVIIEANAVFQVILTSERKYSKAKKPKNQGNLKYESANCCIWNKLKNRWSSPASRGFCLAWLLALMKSFARLVCRVVSLFAPPFSLGVKKITTRQTSFVNDFVRAKR